MKSIKLVPLLLGFILAIPLLLAACGSGEPQALTFDLEIQGQALVQGESVLQVKQGDTVTIVVSADEQLSFHLHGYDLEADASPEAAATLAFTANATGSFPFAIHIAEEEAADHTHDEPDEVELGRLEVQPR